MVVTGPPAPLHDVSQGGHFIFKGDCVVEVKKWASFQEQADKLAQRGCDIGDNNFCLEVLKRINYYRLTAYFLPFKINEEDRYKAGTSIEAVYRIYDFDKKIRAVLFSALEDIEILFRAQIAYYHSEKYGALGYLDKETFSKLHKPDKFTKNLNAEIDRNKKIPFVAHHINKYNRKLPLWVAVDLFSFSTLSLFYSDLHIRDQKELAKIMYPGTPYNHDILKSWLRCCTDLRNICAHHSRLYYRIFSATPKTPTGQHFRLGKKLFDMIYVVCSLHPDGEAWNNSFLRQIESLVWEYEPNLAHIGFPSDWAEKLKRLVH